MEKQTPKSEEHSREGGSLKRDLNIACLVMSGPTLSYFELGSEFPLGSRGFYGGN